MDEKDECQMLYMNILSVMGKKYSDKYALQIVREIFETEKCDKYSNLSFLRESYQKFVDEKKLFFSMPNLANYYPSSEPSKELIKQAYLHHYILTKVSITKAYSSVNTE